MGIFKKDKIKINKEDINDAKSSSASFGDIDVQKRAFINVLGVRLGVNNLFSQKIDVNNVFSLYTINAIRELVDIADIYFDDLKIDVRVVFNEEELFIPKSHSHYGIEPDVYMFIEVEELARAKVLGYLTPDKIDKTQQNSAYYFVDKRDLENPKNVKKFLQSITPKTKKPTLNSDEVNLYFVKLLDKTLTEEQFKKFVYSVGADVKLRETLSNFENFNFVANAVFESNLWKNDGFMNVVGTQDNYSEEEQETLEDVMKDDVVKTSNEIIEETLRNAEQTIEDAENTIDNLLSDVEGADISEISENEEVPEENPEETTPQDNTEEETTDIFEELEEPEENPEETIPPPLTAEAETTDIFEELEEPEENPEETTPQDNTEEETTDIFEELEEPEENPEETTPQDNTEEETTDIFEELEEPEETTPQDNTEEETTDILEEHSEPEETSPQDDEFDLGDIDDLFGSDDDLSDVEDNTEDSENKTEISDETDILSIADDNTEPETQEETDILSFAEDDDTEIIPEEKSETSEILSFAQDEPETTPEITAGADILSFAEDNESEITPEKNPETSEMLSFAQDEPETTQDVEQPSLSGFGILSEESSNEDLADITSVDMPKINVSENSLKFVGDDTQTLGNLDIPKEDIVSEFNFTSLAPLTVDDDTEEIPHLKNQVDYGYSFELGIVSSDEEEPKEETPQEEPEKIEGFKIQEPQNEELKIEQPQEEKPQEDNVLADDEFDIMSLSELDDFIDEEEPENKTAETKPSEELEIKAEQEIKEMSETTSSDADIFDDSIADLSELDDFFGLDENPPVPEPKSEVVSENISENIDEKIQEILKTTNESTNNKDNLNLKVPQISLTSNLDNVGKNIIDLDKIIESTVKETKKQNLISNLFKHNKTDVTKKDNKEKEDNSNNGSTIKPLHIVSVTLSVCMLFTSLVALGTFIGIKLSNGVKPKIPEPVVPKSEEEEQMPATNQEYLTQPLTAKIENVSWEVPENLAYNDVVREYLQLAGKNIKLNLQNEFLLTTEYVYSEKFVVDLRISKTGEVLSSNVSTSSGSKIIDKMIVNTITDTLKHLKIPADNLEESSMDISLVVSF